MKLSRIYTHDDPLMLQLSLAMYVCFRFDSAFASKSRTMSRGIGLESEILMNEMMCRMNFLWISSYSSCGITKQYQLYQQFQY